MDSGSKGWHCARAGSWCLGCGSALGSGRCWAEDWRVTEQGLRGEGEAALGQQSLLWEAVTLVPKATLARKPAALVPQWDFLSPWPLLGFFPFSDQQDKRFEFIRPQTPAQAESLIASWLGPEDN